ncbi:similar to Saccharomyces cerevisiae YGR134W CAF130 Part of the evolutionarily-conserved CCR4- NOT transcriptional regulatory complex involved in controlling mRNA initiation [Maudiozyma barnettii]|uniref:Similar to Saccharomyces cerevisiae YGR134W CAF130 Part of the evolutionarily-conserved CCR4- NOT transcriptional regulatory complex involved in controlling mRNA initiation n=1 Tax=Maudiozyma barnettii TaxID=61262 RepID=A0A8H2ZF60_9SACH|nr:CCR4-NOT core subunit CAF130 [Kazachstania barnettii]CAB4252004.1 similar to Saccharomyces cerevisiae YGR134W CAF130 Part of the evolutionarily-conserved CCR4- NOT transcriptional regulatory complex involved in controlling mRNA initiation [Kazachstania barnettii]CAD1778425.1 similar to Saccharomyces cerevisiae YGR134W CAF130 Part of the evolutionarily-conserved CCR4- NOT transcriptional regulatory complex involved in controlling mRNA initiation [Kazachstania barnettii]
MVPKKKSVSRNNDQQRIENKNTIEHVYDMDRIPVKELSLFRDYNPIDEVFKDWKFISSIKHLEKLFLNEKYLNDSSLIPSLLLEASVIIFLTTRSGISILKVLHHIVYFSEPKDPLQVSLINLKRWLEKNKEIHRGYKNMRENWDSNQQIYLLKLLRFLILNRDESIDITQYHNCLHKISLSSLIDSPSNKASFILDENYNLLLDFIIYFQPLIDTILELALRSFLMKIVVLKYKRTYEFNDQYMWYSFDCEKYYYNTVPLSYAYLATMPLARSEMASTLQNGGVGTDYNKIDDVNSLAGSNGKANISQWLNGIIIKKQSYLDESNGASDSVIQAPINKDELIFSWELDESNRTIKVPNMVQQTVSRHSIISRLLKLETLDSPFLLTQFKVLSGLVDPLTQPLPNDTQIISIDLLYQMFIGLIVKHYKVNNLVVDDGFDWRFLVCFNMQKIIRQSLKKLNCEDYERLTSVTNNSEKHWKGNLHKWLPKGMNTQDLELVYMINIMAVYTIYSLYSHLPIQMNPFLSSMIQLWKNLSCVILLGLEIDRMEEVHETFETPLMVRATIRGSAALRVVVATVLNQHVEVNQHDFKHEPFNTFMSPYGRKLCQGSLLADLRTHSASMFALGCGVTDITELLADLQAGDRFDEDVRYMFEYEYDDYNDIEYEDDENRTTDEGSEKVRRRCHCIFEDDKIAQETSHVAHDKANHDEWDGETRTDRGEKSGDDQLASRIKSSFEFDYSGKDWRDVPRGFNFYFSPNYKFIKYPKLEDVYKLILKATSDKLSEDEAKTLLKSVASCVKIEQEQILIQNAGLDLAGQQLDDDNSKLVTPDDIYEIWCEESAFERMLYQNQQLSWRLMDEMLMCSGYRRVLIWFITHTEINHSLIHYIFELAMGLRGQKFDMNVDEQGKKNDLLSNLMVDKDEKCDPQDMFKFSRQGNIILSNIENKMLLQEFFTSAAIYFTTIDGHDRANLSTDSLDDDLNHAIKEGDNVSLYSIGLIKLICYMVQTLMKSNKFDFSKSECTFELQTLLINWIGIIPEAQELFFSLKSAMAKDDNDEEKYEESEVEEGNEELISSSTRNSRDSTNNSSTINDPIGGEQSISKYNDMLLKLLPVKNHDDELDDKTNVAVDTLTMFLHKHSLIHKVPIIGRKSLHYADDILPLPDADKPLGISMLMAEANESMGYMSPQEL